MSEKNALETAEEMMGRRLLQFASVSEQEDGTYAVEGVEVFAEGTWHGKEFTDSDLKEMETNFTALRGEVQPGVKLGHVDSIEGGLEAPRFGTVSRIYRKGKKLFADFLKVPAEVGKIIEAGGYPRVSIELWHKFKSAAGQVYHNVIDAVALLGSTLPEVSTLSEMAALYQADPVRFEREDGEVFAYDYLPPDRFGLLTDRVQEEETQRALSDLQWAANDIVFAIMNGDGEFEGLSVQEKKTRISEVLDELDAEMGKVLENEEFSDSDEPEGTSSHSSRSSSGTEHEEESGMGRNPEETAAAEQERDDLVPKEKYDATLKENESLKEDLRQERTERVSSDARQRVEAWETKGLLLPFERSIVEPMMVAAMVAESDEESRVYFEKASEGEEDEAEKVLFSDGIAALIEGRHGIDRSLFRAVLKTVAGEESETPSEDGLTAAEKFAKRIATISDEEEVPYRTAYRKAREKYPDLARQYDEEVGRGEEVEEA